MVAVGEYHGWWGEGGSVRAGLPVSCEALGASTEASPRRELHDIGRMYEAKCLVMDYHNHAAVTPAQPPAHHQFHQLHPLAPDSCSSSRWSQYQQLWRQHHMFINGESQSNLLKHLFTWPRIGNGVCHLLLIRYNALNTD